MHGRVMHEDHRHTPAPRGALLIGAGGWGASVARALAMSPRWRLAALADTDARALAAAAATHGIAPAGCFPDAATALREADHDAVVIAAPNPARMPALLAAIGAGRPVLAEKPLVHTPQDLSRVARALERSRGPLMVAQNYRFDPAARALRRLVASGDAGALRRVDVRFGRDGRAFAGHAVARMAGPAGLLMELGVHHLDLLRFLVGCEGHCGRAEAGTGANGFAGWTSVRAELAFADGTRARYTARYDAGRDETPWGGQWRLVFDTVEVVWYPCPPEDAPAVTFHPGPPAGWNAPPAAPLASAQRTAMLLAALDEFADALDAAREPECGFADNARTLGLAFAISRAAGHPPDGNAP